MQKRRIYEFRVDAASTLLSVEVFDQAGLRLITSDTRGSFFVRVAFAATDFERVKVRVRSVAGATGGPTAVGPYTASFVELGFDDYPGSPALAEALPDQSFDGVVDFVSDVDIAWVQSATRIAVRFTPAVMGDAGPPETGIGNDAGGPTQPPPVPHGVDIEFSGDAGTFTIRDAPATLILPAGERVFLTARGRYPTDVGPFRVDLVALGPDDHSDSAAFATPISADGNTVAGAFERFEDVDTFQLPVIADHLYRAFWSPGLWVSLSDPLLVSGGTELIWTAPQTTSVLLTTRAAQPLSNLPTYGLTVVDLISDDHADDFASATPLAVAQSQGGRLELPGDIDAFTVATTAGRVMRVAVTVASGLQVTVFDSRGNEIGTAIDGFRFLAESGPMFVKVRRGPTSSEGLVQYGLTVTDQGPDDHADSAATATPVPFGAQVAGVIQYPGDVDVFSFTSSVERLYELSVLPSTLRVAVQDPAGAPLQLGSGGSGGPWTRFIAPAGRTTIHLSSDFAMTPAYSLLLTDLGAEDHGATPQTATALPLDTPIPGVLGHRFDVDMFSLAVVAGHTYEVTLTSGLTVSWRDASNRPVVGQPSYAYPYFFAAADGVIYPMVEGQLPNSYVISVADLGLDDHGETMASATPVTGSAASGRIQHLADVDFFSVPVTSLHFYELSWSGSAGAVVPWHSTNAALPPRFKMFGSVLFVRAAGFSSATASYAWTLVDLGADDHEDTAAAGTPLTLAVPASGQLTIPSDLDAFSINLSAITPVEVILSGPASVAVSSPDGSVVATTSTSVMVTPQQSGTWSFVVSAPTACSYTLTVQ